MKLFSVVLMTALVMLMAASCGGTIPAAASPTVTATPTPLATMTAAPSATPRVFRVRWMYLPEKGVVVLQQDGFTQYLQAARLKAPDGTIIASAEAHDALPGEPRVCGVPEIVPPLVVTLPVSPDVVTGLANVPAPPYVLEVREEGWGWHQSELVDWTKIAGAPCWQAYP